MRILAWPASVNAKSNPYNNLLYKHMVGLGVIEYSHKAALLENYDILHIHWPDGYINEKSLLKTLQRIILLSAVVMLAKLKGAKLVWTVHNLAPHDAFYPHLAGVFLKWFALQANGLIFLSRSSMETYRERYGLARRQVSAIVPHGHYRDIYPSAQARDSARKELGLPPDKEVFLFLGLIKPYKNVDRLVADFIALDNPEAVLVVAGAADDEMAQALFEQASGHENIRLFLNFIPDERLGLFYGAADLVVLPFRNILNSGSALLSLSYNRPIIAPALGSMMELKETVGDGWVHLYHDDFSVHTLRDALKVKVPSGTCDLGALDWNVIAAQTQNFYREVLGA